MNEQILSCMYIQILIYIYSRPCFFFQSLIFDVATKVERETEGQYEQKSRPI